jgi:hypothetical protein
VSDEAWPTPTGGPPSREPLPRVEDLPVAEQGYEQESVKAAFDSFYRHAAQLDAALRTLEAVDSFHRHAAALRADLRALRTAGWTQQPWNVTPTFGYGYSMRAPREGISPAVWRIGGEVAFLIAVSVALGVAQLVWWVIALVMALAFLIIVAIEWISSRERWMFARPATTAHPVVEAAATTPSEQADESLGWTAFEEAQEPSDAMTIIAATPVEEEREAAPAEEEPEPETEPESVDEAPVEDEPPIEEGPPQPRSRWWRRRQAVEDTDEGEPAVEVPRHVRVLAHGEETDDPWEETESQ